MHICAGGLWLQGHTARASLCSVGKIFHCVHYLSAAPRNLDEKLVDIEQPHCCLKSGEIKEETESTIVAAQDQAISTNHFKNKILKEDIQSECRLCKQHEETIDHLTSGCPILAKNKYLTRHNKVCAHMHYSKCKILGSEMTDKWYTHMPKSMYEEEDVTVLWNQAVHTGREVTANRPDTRVVPKLMPPIYFHGNYTRYKEHNNTI